MSESLWVKQWGMLSNKNGCKEFCTTGKEAIGAIKVGKFFNFFTATIAGIKCWY